MSGKRKAEGGSGGRGKKKYISKAPPSGSKAGIPQGSRGILISCTTSKEQQAGREATQLFGEAYEALGGTWKRAADGGAAAAAAPADGDAPTDIAAALAAEVAEAKDTSKQPLFYHMVGIHSVVFLELRDPEGPSPTALVHHVCRQVEERRQNPTRFCNRFYPVEQTCYASLDKIGELAAAVVPQHFPEGADQPIEFAVQYDARAAPPLERMQVIDAFAQRVPKPHKVNLNAPQKTIVVNVVRSTAGVAVVERYRELLRFNIRSLAMSDEERAAAAAAQAQAQGGGGAGGGKKQQQEQQEQQEQQQQPPAQGQEQEQPAVEQQAGQQQEQEEEKGEGEAA